MRIRRSFLLAIRCKILTAQLEGESLQKILSPIPPFNMLKLEGKYTIY